MWLGYEKAKKIIKLGSFDQDILGEFEFSLGTNSVQNSEAGNWLEWRVDGISTVTCMAKRMSLIPVTEI